MTHLLYFTTYKSVHILSIILTTVYIYILVFLLFFSIIFFLDLSKIYTITDIKNISYHPGLTSLLILVFLVLGGIPPFIIFISKLLIIGALLKYSLLFFYIIFLPFNFFILYFYIQNIRFFLFNEPTMLFVYKNSYIYFDFVSAVYTTILSFIVLFGYIFIYDIYIISYYFSLLIILT